VDALTQLIEPYVSTRANLITDALCLEGLQRVGRSLRRACDDGSDLDARTDMAFASLLGGMALANAGLGVVHGLAAPIGGMFDAPHGAVCAAILPHGVAANVRAVRERDPDSKALSRYSAVARVLAGTGEADTLVEWLRALSRDLGILPLRAYGIRAEHAPELAEKASNASSMRANPLKLSGAELQQVIVDAV
jgi:alcohol dehydrogenase class IV